MKILNFIVISLALTLVGCTPKTTPTPTTASGVVWNRYADDKSSFEVLSLDDEKGRYLYDNIDSIKAWIMVRWALANDQFPAKCKVMVVPSKDVFKELFGKDAPQYRVSRDSANKIQELTVWVTTDDPHWHTGNLTRTLTEVSLQNYEAKQGKIGYWAHRGFAVLNGDIATIRQMLGNLAIVFQRDTKIYWSKEILNMTPDVLAKHPIESSIWFDNESAAFCLMLFKEYGAKKFNDFLSQSREGPEAALKNVYGFKSYADCDLAFKAYMKKISDDITGKGTVPPNSALTWPTP